MVSASLNSFWYPLPVVFRFAFAAVFRGFDVFLPCHQQRLHSLGGRATSFTVHRCCHAVLAFVALIEEPPGTQAGTKGTDQRQLFADLRRYWLSPGSMRRRGVPDLPRRFGDDAFPVVLLLCTSFLHDEVTAATDL